MFDGELGQIFDLTNLKMTFLRDYLIFNSNNMFDWRELKGQNNYFKSEEIQQE